MITAKIVTEPFEAVIGNDFKINVNTITDIEGNPLNLDTTFIEIEWQDIGGIKYLTRHDPRGESENCKIEDGKLQIIFDKTRYRFRYPDVLNYRVRARSYDGDQRDNSFDIWTPSQTSNISLNSGSRKFGCQAVLAHIEMPYAPYKGDRGEQGEIGAQGARGDRGEQGTIGERGEKGDRGEQGSPGATGQTGKSAYEIAVENGYNGTEQQFGVEQGAIAGNSARLASVETSKANLINGTISPDEISPLLGRQTGISLKGNSYYERETTSDIENNFGSGNFSLECYLNYDLSTSDIKATFNMFAIRDQNNRDTLAFYRQYTGAISVYLNSRREDGSYEQLGLTFRMSKGINHVILTMDRINKTLTGYSNGVKFGSVNFKESVSYTTKEFIIIGDKSASNGAQPFIAKHLRIFNYPLLEQDVNMLYNFGHPEDFNLDYQRNSISANRCVYEFLPYGITLNTWRDTIKGLNLAGKGLSENRILNYEKQSLSSLAPLFIARGAVFNNSTGFYELNGLIDITESQMISIYNSGYSSVGYTPFLYKSSLFRTNLPPHDGVLDTGGGSILAYFEGCAFLEVARCDCNAKAITRAFNGCIRLRSIITPKTRFLILNCNTAESTRLAFKDCHLLEDVLLDGLNVSISFADSPNLKRECVVYMINKSKNTAPITITLHATAKARLTDEDIALAVSKNITIA